MKLATQILESLETKNENFTAQDVNNLVRMIAKIETDRELMSFLNAMGSKFEEAFEANYGEKELKEFKQAHEKYVEVLTKYYGDI